MNQCQHCRYAEYDPRTAPILWCVKHGDEAVKPCEQFEREPGSDDDQQNEVTA